MHEVYGGLSPLYQSVAPAPAASGWPHAAAAGASLCDLDGAVTGTAPASGPCNELSVRRSAAAGLGRRGDSVVDPMGGCKSQENTAGSTPAGSAPMTRRKGCMPI
eukprot:6198038-Pleurochrysis_carterae.AAC.1